jgi:hypothetical protein
VLLVLGACGEVNDPSQEPQESKAQDIGYNEGDLVTVKVAVPKQTTNRSVNADSVEFFANIYEVVFREVDPDTGIAVDVTDGATYYRGEGPAVQGYVDVPVKPNKNYDVLLLAGYNRTLLAAGYSNNTTKKGWPIKSGQANLVTIEVKKLPLQWDGSDTIVKDNTDKHKSANDFGFAADFTDTDLDIDTDDGNRWITLGGISEDGTTIDPDLDTFTVLFNIAKLEQLYLAEGGSTLTIEDHKVVLWPRYVGEFFTPVVLSPDVSSNPVIGPSGSGPYKYESIDATSTISFTNVPLLKSITDDPNPGDFVMVPNNKLPAKDIDGVLQFELTYRAFGTEKSKGTPWIIRNGLDRTEDKTPDTSAGSYFVVKIGAGTPPKDENVTITY